MVIIYKEKAKKITNLKTKIVSPFELIGVVDMVRFINQYTTGHGNYAEEWKAEQKAEGQVFNLAIVSLLKGAYGVTVIN